MHPSSYLPPDPWKDRWQRFSAASVRAFHAYATWLVGITWKRFIVLAILLVVAANVLSELPPFSWRVTETVIDTPADTPTPPKPPREPVVKIERAKPGMTKDGVDISIDERGVRITPRAKGAAGAETPASAASAAAPHNPEVPMVQLNLPPNLPPDARAAIEEAVRDATDAAQEALRDQKEALAEALRDLEQAKRDATQAAEGVGIKLPGGKVHRTRLVHWGDFIPNLAFFWVLASAVVKGTYKGRVVAEVKAAQATQTAESEALKRQVVEARMAAMQAQVEPHFLFNTLASIDHLIETDPTRASAMQKNLIALLRASMPTMREANQGGVRDLKREFTVIRPYLEILKVRMEDRLQTQIEVPDGLMSAEFPPMMIQSLVENAIKHGLEPKAEGGSLNVKAEIVHGKLAVSVTDTGLGFGKAATAGTGVGLANIRERLALLYGNKASVTVTENQPSGTVVTILVPYRSVDEGAQA
jgi:Histidine kinase/Histidine kinase-, DNA gyrase B-, and HSP90-like ATPase